MHRSIGGLEMENYELIKKLLVAIVRHYKSEFNFKASLKETYGLEIDVIESFYKKGITNIEDEIITAIFGDLWGFEKATGYDSIYEFFILDKTAEDIAELIINEWETSRRG